MSGKKVAVSQRAVPQRAQAAAACSAVNKSDASARWAALDSRHERLVTASDAVLGDLDRKGDRRMAS